MKCLFLWPLLFCVSDYDRKIKKQPLTVTINKKPERSYLTYIFRRLKIESSNKVYVKTKLI